MINFPIWTKRTRCETESTTVYQDTPHGKIRTVKTRLTSAGHQAKETRRITGKR